MFLLGLIILAAAVVGSVELILANTQPVTLHMWSWTWHFDAFWLAVCGAVLITAAWLALGAMRLAAVHQMRMRRERRELAAENERLAAAVQRTDGKARRPGFGHNRPARGSNAPEAQHGTAQAPAPVTAPAGAPTQQVPAPAAPAVPSNTAAATPGGSRR